jgi:response regulator RpfG family c-di-GMP phosphodiesterase
MANTISPQNFICDALINEDIYVVVLDDNGNIRETINDFISKELGWKVIIVETREDAVILCQNKRAVFYILDINLGKERSQEGIDTAEEIKTIDENVFVSIFSGVPNLDPHKKMAKRIGVNYFEEKGNVVRKGVSRIAVKMLLFQRNLLDNILESYLQSSIDIDGNEILKVVNKIKEVNKKLEDIQKLERSYQSDSTEHPLPCESIDFFAELAIDEDKNIQAYELYKQNVKWWEEYQNKYVAFVDGEWLPQFVADNSHDLLNYLRNSEHKNKAILYKLVGEEQIIELPFSFLEIPYIE